jgi:RHS repeat-associated protein
VFATNTSGVKVWTASYDPFGAVRTTTGTPIPARFPGQWFQSESGLHQNWMRDYDPTTGRYLQADPLGLVDGASVYGYGGQNPMANTDPTGECFGPLAYVCSAVVGAVGGVALGYLLDDDGCYTWEEARRDALYGAFGGVAFKAIGAGYGLWRGAAAAAAAKSAAQGAAVSAAANGGSRALASALAANGVSRGSQEAAHHIAAAGAKAAAPAREALARVGIGIDDAINGVFLPVNRAAANPFGAAVHSTVHTNAYYQAVNAALRNVRTREQAIEILGDMAQRLRSGGL